MSPKFEKLGSSRIDYYGKKKSNAGEVIGGIIALIFILWVLGQCAGG